MKRPCLIIAPFGDVIRHYIRLRYTLLTYRRFPALKPGQNLIGLSSERGGIWFFWEGCSLVYADKPQTLDHLEDNIHRVIADIRPQMLEKVIENWTSRLDYIQASRSSPMPEIIFKM
ncbi:hypothetical protein TNCV_1956081 [Trichonephila clavipes]|nr:hypothetical protein TNCV_1956081 [Trichonephila clavipes]